jgi:hypothetical protein
LPARNHIQLIAWSMGKVAKWLKQNGEVKMRDLLAKILPESLMEQVERESRSWYFKCSCGHEFDIWSMGGVRYKATRQARSLTPFCKLAGLAEASG